MYGYPAGTKIVFWGLGMATQKAFYKFRAIYQIVGIISDKTNDHIENLATYPEKDILNHINNGTKIITCENPENTCKLLNKNFNLIFYEHYLPIGLLEYEEIDCLKMYSLCPSNTIGKYISFFKGGKKGVFINGNCQAEPTSKYLKLNERFSKSYIILKTTAVHQYGTNVGLLLEKGFLENIDVLLTQRISLNNHHCQNASSEILRKNIPKESLCLVIPNFWFTGYFPQHKKNDHNVMEDISSYGAFFWGDSVIDDFVEKGYSAKQIIELCNDEHLFSKEEIMKKVAENFEDLEDREKFVDIKTVNLIKEQYDKKILFYSANHPVNFLIKESVKKILQAIGLYEDTEEICFRNEYQIDNLPLLKSVTEAIYPSVLSLLGLLNEKDKVSYSSRNSDFCDFNQYLNDYLTYCHQKAVL